MMTKNLGTKKILILVYIAMVLALSSLAKAADDRFRHGTGIIEDAALNRETGVLSVSGHLSTKCELSPTVKVLSVDEYRGIIHVAVLTDYSYVTCAGELGDAFTAHYDLHDIRLVPGRTYNVELENYVGEPVALKYKAFLSAEDAERLEAIKKEFIGNLIYTTDHVHILNNGSNSAQVIAPRLPLERLSGIQVRMSAYVVEVGGRKALLPTSVSATLP